jgi:lauroyl/myristoyl acyltransferase
MRDPGTVRRHVAARGEEHLAAAGPGVILLGAHLGPPQSYLALRALGHRLTWVGSRGASPAWRAPIRDRYQRGHGDLLFPGVERAWERRLYRARDVLLDGGNVFISADGSGARAFSVRLPGGEASIGSGWLLLRRATKAPVLPVLSHMEGRLQVVTIHPPLPAAVADAALDRAICRDALAAVLGAYVRRFPEQCYSLVFGLPPDEPPPPGGIRR